MIKFCQEHFNEIDSLIRYKSSINLYAGGFNKKSVTCSPSWEVDHVNIGLFNNFYLTISCNVSITC